jgi:hypothetical protein
MDPNSKIIGTAASAALPVVMRNDRGTECSELSNKIMSTCFFIISKEKTTKILGK